MTSITRRRLLPAGIVVAAAVIAAAGFWATLGRDSGGEQAQAQEVDLVRVDGSRARVSLDEAVNVAAQETGIELKLPSYVPEGLQVRMIDPDPGVDDRVDSINVFFDTPGTSGEEPPGQPSIQYTQVATGLEIFPPGDDARVLPADLPGFTLYVQDGEGYFPPFVAYSLIGTGEAFYARVRSETRMDDGEVIKLFKSLFE